MLMLCTPSNSLPIKKNIFIRSESCGVRLVLVHPVRVERTIFAFGGQCIIQLCYGCNTLISNIILLFYRFCKASLFFMYCPVIRRYTVRAVEYIFNCCSIVIYSYFCFNYCIVIFHYFIFYFIF